MIDGLDKQSEILADDPGRATPERATPEREINTVVSPKEQSSPLFSLTDSQGFRSQWDAVQTGFVDEPRKSVEQADKLVETVIQRLSAIFADERTKLEGQWEKGDNVSTEDLRLALQRYRSFFTRLLSV
jgi:hypothetical protein